MFTINDHYEVLSWLDRPNGTPVSVPNFQPHSIKRLSDGEIFTIGDRVTNGTAMCGNITEFSLLESDLYVNHTYSGVGMNVGSLLKVRRLPSKYQQGDKVILNLQTPKVVITKVHFSANNISYDIQLWLDLSKSIRLYNIDESILVSRD